MTTKHTHQLIFGRKVEDCPRCDELLNGALAVKGWGYFNKQMDEQRTIDIRNHNCKRSGCGTVCTAFDW